MPQVRAVKPMFHNAQRRRIGEVFEITEAQLAHAKLRWKEKQIRPAFELVITKKPEPEATDLV